MAIKVNKMQRDRVARSHLAVIGGDVILKRPGDLLEKRTNGMQIAQRPPYIRLIAAKSPALASLSETIRHEIFTISSGYLK